MIKSVDQKVKAAPGDKAAAVVRQLASAFRQVDEFEPFVKGLEAALGKAEFFDRATLNLYPKLGENGDGTDPKFPAGALCLPLSGHDGVLGMANISNGGRKFGPDDLHLMAGLADLISVLMDHALQFGEQRQNLAMLMFLLNQAPVGILCVDAQGEILASNPLGLRLAGISAATGESSVLPDAWKRDVEIAFDTVGQFHRREAGRLLHVQVKSAPTESEKSATALVLVDLTPELEKFHEALARETYRCCWMARPLSMVLLSAANPGDLMPVLRPIREALGAAAIVGPCDTDAIGIIFPDTGFARALEKLRGIRSLLESDWEAGVALSDEVQGEPDSLFSAARAGRVRVGDFLQHRLLLHDDYASVNDMLELILRDSFSIMKSSDFAATLRHLRTGYYDGFFTEINLSNGGDVVELARAARQVNPRIKPFFTSCAAESRRDEPAFSQEIVFRKPFDVREVVSAVKHAFDAS